MEDNTGMHPCQSPYCECDTGKCTHPGFYDARGQSHRLYAERDTDGLGSTYAKHVMAMTAEDLRAKSAIAAELAYRDARIAELEALLQAQLPRSAIPFGHVFHDLNGTPYFVDPCDPEYGAGVDVYTKP